MQTNYVKVAFSAFWLSAAVAAGVAVQLTSLLGWTVLAACALLPLVVVRQLWREPAPSMSESIQQALR